jgi:cell division protein FtsZ
MGAQVTQGLGAGSHPELVRAAAEETLELILQHLNGTHMLFITAGMGGGTGTGAAPVIAKAAQEVQNLFRVANEKTTFSDAFAMADEVLHSGVACITELIVKEGLINLDFADVRAIMRENGKAMKGRGEGFGEKRVLTAAEAAISNPLIEDAAINRAKGLLVSINGGRDMTLFEVDEAANRIREQADLDANIIIRATFDDSLEGMVRVSVVATGIDTADGPQQWQRVQTALTDISGNRGSEGHPLGVQPTPTFWRALAQADQKSQGDSPPARLA